MCDSCVLFMTAMVKKERWDEEGLYETWVVLRPYMVALAALAPLRLNSESDALCIATHISGSNTR